MTTQPTIIDLGIVPPGDAPADVPVPAPALGRRLRTRWRRWAVTGWRQWAAAGLVGLLLLSAAAAAAPRPDWLLAHFSVAWSEGIPDVDVRLTAEVMFVTEHPATGNARTTAYRLADGTVLWESTEEVQVRLGMPMIVGIGQTDDGAWLEQTAILDIWTGEQSWQRDGYPAIFIDDRLLLWQRLPGQNTDGPAFPMAFAGHDRDTGEVIWELPVVELVSFAYGESGTRFGAPAERASHLVTLDAEGGLASFDLTTGARLAATGAGTLPATAQLSVVGETVLVQPDPNRSRYDAFDLETLTHRWQRELPAEQLWELVGCGPVVCDVGDGRRPQAVDPDTGELLWLAGFQHQWDRFPPHPVPYGDYLLFGRWLVAAATGERVLELGDWLPAPLGPDEVILTRYDRDWSVVVEPLGPGRQRINQRESGRTWFARLRLDPPGIEVLGRVPTRSADERPWNPGCVLTTGYVACEDQGGTHVWRVR